LIYYKNNSYSRRFYAGQRPIFFIKSSKKVVRMIKHVVMWKLKNVADAAQFKSLLDSCHKLVPGMLSFEIATASAGLEANVDVLLNSAFTDQAALDAYQQHPHHQAVGKQLGPLRESRYVLDYEVIV
jgi:quinol monooxygenase YgiN